MNLKVIPFWMARIFRSISRYVNLTLFIFLGRVQITKKNKFKKRCAVLYKVPLTPKCHSNDTEIEIIRSVFVGMGYCVDLYDYKSSALFPFIQYDCIFGFGDLFDQICCSPKKPKMIHYLTGRPQWLSDAAECYEIRRLSKRVKISPIRYMNRSAAASLLLSDHVAYVGRGANLQEAREIRHDIVGVRLAAEAPTSRAKNLERDRNKVLFFGSVGAAHKGLFKFFEIASIWGKTFPDVNLEWAVVGDLSELEVEALKEYSFIMGQEINFLGNLNIAEASKYYSQSAYIINPSTSEGCCTSLIESMRCGIVPIFSEYSGVNSTEIDFLEIKSNDPCDYVSTLMKLVEMSQDEYLHLVKKCMSVCNDHTIDIFRHDIESFLRSALMSS